MRPTKANYPDPLPITAILPVYNCAHRMREHMENAQGWLRHVAEVVVVDSHSTDETLAIIKEYTASLDVKYVQHPPGLYACWNRGVQEATSPFIYFSTIGDHISYAGLCALLGTIRRFHADVAISPPRFTYESGTAVKSKEVKWPIHEIIDDLKLTEPTLMDQRVLYNYILVYLERAVLGSSASNLYKRTILKRYPFSDDFLSAGDSSWIIEHNFDVRVAIHPEVLASYLFHVKDWSYDLDEAQRGQLLRRRFAYRAYSRSLDNSPKLSPSVARDLKQVVEDSLGQPIEKDIRPVDMGFLHKIIQQQTVETQLLLDQLNAVNLRLEYLQRKQAEKAYRQRLGALRYIWLPAVQNRRARKKLKLQLDEMSGIPGLKWDSSFV
ncbi:glycosyltransferase family 2 protein [Coraliomargarita parva]|uniref:glycosyltransferase family 2 protein n=1 Tax=Coraliomargarita parva TaxID=3014050 RepID=UPI0022B58FAA|nr:glycosyltransferase family A protein [Coraliomargarita parva]